MKNVFEKIVNYFFHIFKIKNDVIIFECGRNNILLTLLTGVVVSAVLISFEHFINIPVKKQVIRTNIKDYLENFLLSKLEYNRSRVVAQQGENLVNLVNAKKIQKEPANTMLQKEKGKLLLIFPFIFRFFVSKNLYSDFAEEKQFCIKVTKR